jgi:hypothetical protein
MDTESTSKQDKQVTVDVPEERVAEFYAWYGRFLAHAGSRSGRGPRGRRHGHGGGHGHGCGRRSQAAETEATVTV